MTDQEINLAIAIKVGYHFEKWTEPSGEEYEVWVKPDGKTVDIDMPDFCNDLNAMHEAEESAILTEHPSIKWDYRFRLSGLTNHNYWHATARQRAKAFLLTFGLWKD